MKTTETLESIKSIININNGMGGSVSFYLVSFSKIVELLFENLEAATLLNQKYIQNAIKLMELSTHLEALHKRLTEDKKGEKKEKQVAVDEDPNAYSMLMTETLKSDYRLRILTLFNLIKVHLLN